jgi:hypothetical protein
MRGVKELDVFGRAHELTLQLYNPYSGQFLAKVLNINGSCGSS